MGKYIIRLERGETAYKTVNSNGTPMIQLLAPAPYTEPDMEQVRKEAYDKGYDDATAEIGSDEQAIAEKAYRKGLEDAWEATRKIANMDTEERGKVFGEIFIQNIQNIYSAPEAIEKIREYEKEEIEVGDEVIYDGKRCVVIFPQTEHLRATIIDCGRFHHSHIVEYDELKKTGRHFPEIAEVLRKMKETNNG